MLRFMALARELEDRIERKLYRQGKILGGVYVGRGQEAIGVASAIQTLPDDVICPSHRDMGAFLVRGMTPPRVLAQYMGRRDGYTRGRDGNLHMGDLGLNIIAFVSMLADSVPIAAGIALSFRIRKQNRVVLCYFGDGATSRGDWHEGMNLAGVRKLPVVFICNNNQYAYSTPLAAQMAVANVADRAASYGMPGETIDGNDVLAVYESVRQAIARARAGEGPTLIECRTFRMTGHSAHDDASYVPKRLFKEWESKDPILRYEQWLLREGVLRRTDIDYVHRSVIEEVDRAVEWAEDNPYPPAEDCLRGVYHE
ncbi:MAG: thiamine pyrophosphate-dependent dehydrogenase E1 component subunit alpha [Acidobacteria bacterium]|nr:thiamine pyrophosphate-dependent dehydrogenase E1 component subunit alpha [Acidobacteriota bacterium]